MRGESTRASTKEWVLYDAVAGEELHEELAREGRTIEIVFLFLFF